MKERLPKITPLRISAPYILIIGFAFFMFRGIFNSGFMSGYDNSLHYYESYYLTQILIPHYHWISGWSMQQLGGCPVLLEYPQVGFILIAFLNKLLLLPLVISYKTVVLLSYIVLGFGFYKLSSYRFGKIASLLVTISLMLQRDIYCDRILNGIWNNYLAIGIFFIFFHMLDKDIKNMTFRKALILGLLLGFIVLSHVYVAMFAFALIVIYTIPYLIQFFKKGFFFKNFLIYSTTPSLALIVSSYYLNSFIIGSTYFEKLGIEPIKKGFIWGLKSFFGPLESMNSVAGFMINVPVLIRIIFSFFGIYIFFKNSKKSDVKHFLTYVLIIIFICLALFSGIFTRLPFWRSIPLITTIQFARLVVYIHIGMYIFAAYGIAVCLGRFKKKAVTIGLCTAPLIISVFFHYSYLAGDASRTLDKSPHMLEIFRIWNWVNNNIPPGEQRIVYEDTIGNVSDPILTRSDVFALSGIFTSIPQIGVSRSASPFPQEKYMRNDHGLIFSRHIGDVGASFIADMMNNFNAGHIVTTEPNLKNKLDKSGLFIKKQAFGMFDIFQLKNHAKGWITFKNPCDYKMIIFENQYMKFDIENKHANNEVFIKVAYHPFWHARLNGRPADIIKTEFSMMKICLPDKRHYLLELTFNSFNKFWTIISLAGVISAVFFIGFDIVRFWK